MLGVATLTLEIALATRGVDGRYVVCKNCISKVGLRHFQVLCVTFLHNCGKELELFGRVEAHEVHAPVAAKVAAVEPVPIFKLVPRLPPRQKVIVTFPFHMRDS